MIASPVRIGVLGHVGNGNLGDEAIIAAFIANVRHRVRDAQLVAFTINPSDTRDRHQVEAFPLRRSRPSRTGMDGPATVPTTGARDRAVSQLRSVPVLFTTLKLARDAVVFVTAVISEVVFLTQSYRRIRRLSLLVIAGSQQLSDAVGGAWGFPYTVFKWSALARLRGIPVAIVSVGAGPVDSIMARWFVRHTVRMASYVSCRDDVSSRVLRSIGVTRAAVVAPDLAFSLPVPTLPRRKLDRARIVAINPMPFVWQEYDPKIERTLYERYIRALASFTAWLIRRGYQVQFIPTQLRADHPVIRDVVDRLVVNRDVEASDTGRLERPITSLNDLLLALADADVFVATRFHGCVLGCLMGCPVLALAYHAKTRDLMRQAEQERFVVEAQSVSVGDLQQTFIALESSLLQATRKLRSQVPRLQEALAAQYDQVLDMLNRQPSVAAAPAATLHARIPS